MKIFIANIKKVDHPFRYIFFCFKQAFISFIPLKLIKKRQSRRYSFMARQYRMYYVLNICFNFTMILHGYKKKKANALCGSTLGSPAWFEIFVN